tara:strand:+ start:1123 stop:3165 length:2043 start_codon:yes stop_codon:yes gene_type:complete
MKAISKKVVWLCDITHSFQTVAMNKMPLAIGFIAAYCAENISSDITFRLMKFYDELQLEIDTEDPPFLIGFSNYSRNNNLNLEIARRLRELFPDVVIVFGGPNFSLDEDSQTLFLRDAPWIDYYVPFEGEKAFCNLIETILKHEGDKKILRSLPIKHTAQLRNDKFFSGELFSTMDFNDIPSPYLNGYFDKYLDKLVPLVQTARGCPFKCTFCYDGLDNSFANNMRHKNYELLEKELRYIAKNGDPSFELYIADANFGMYKNDIEYCKKIAEIQSEYSGWPWTVATSTGKGQSKRVHESAKLTSGAITITAAVQSTDPSVLKNIKRKNIPYEEMLWLTKENKKISPDAWSYSEIILGLPGGTLETFLTTFKEVVESGIDSISAYQAMLLPGTEMATNESIAKYNIVSKYRVMARCFGEYSWKNKTPIKVAEIEQIIVSTSTMSFEDYLEGRRFTLTISIFYNDFIFTNFFGALKSFGLSIFDLLKKLHTSAQQEMPSIYDQFLKETKDELWDSKDDLEKFVKQEGVLDQYRDGVYGSNLIFKYRTLAHLNHMNIIIGLVYKEVGHMISGDATILEKTPDLLNFLNDMRIAHEAVGNDYLNTKKSLSVSSFYNIKEFMPGSIPVQKIKKYDNKKILTIEHDDAQKRLIDSRKQVDGDDLLARARLLAQVPLKKFLRRGYLN